MRKPVLLGAAIAVASGLGVLGLWETANGTLSCPVGYTPQIYGGFWPALLFGGLFGAMLLALVIGGIVGMMRNAPPRAPKPVPEQAGAALEQLQPV
ncbi:MAG TPA: hypothetical protein VLT37_09500 [Acidocella sp.]|nr:hypothetical protein [Acidocella sp.]